MCRKAWKPVSVTPTLRLCGAGCLGQRHNAVGMDDNYFGVIAATQNACPVYSRPNCFTGPFTPTPELRSVERWLRLEIIRRLVFDFERVFACFSVVRVRPFDGAFAFLCEPDLDLALFCFVHSANILTVF